MEQLVEVRQTIRVKVNEAKFTPEFMNEFNETMHYIDDVQGHTLWLAELYARGTVDEWTDFIEGYGPVKDMGIVFEIEGLERTAVDS